MFGNLGQTILAFCPSDLGYGLLCSCKPSFQDLGSQTLLGISFPRQRQELQLGWAGVPGCLLQSGGFLSPASSSVEGQVCGMGASQSCG